MKKKDIKIVNTVIDKIAILDQKFKNEDVLEARLFYDSLTDEQKSNVSNYELLINAEKKLKEREETPQKKEDKLNAYSIDLQIIATHHLVVKTEFELELKDKSLELCELIIKPNEFITKLDLLNEAKKYLSDYKKELEYKRIALSIDERIKAIKYVSLDNADDIFNIADELRDMDHVIKYMKNYELLISYLNELEYLNRANYLDELILSYNEIELSDEEDLLKLNDDVSNEIDEVKQKMKYIPRLKELISILNELKQDYNNKMLAIQIDRQIELLNVTLNDDEIIYENKKSTYEITQNLIKTIDNDVYKLLNNKDLLKELDILMITINKNHEELENAKEVINLINEIPSVITLDLVDIISNARDAYERLNKSERELVYNYDLLLNIENALYENESAYLVVKEISELKDITLKNEGLIKEINIMYDELKNEEKQLVYNYNILFNANKEIKRLHKNKDLADDLYKRINKADLNKALVTGLRLEYEALDNDTKELVTNINRLTDLEVELNALDEAVLIDDRINDLPFNITYEYLDDLYLIENDYNKLTPKAKSYVKGYNTLLEHIKQIKGYELKINEIIGEINKIGEVDITEGDEIASVKMKYELLDNSLKKYITNYDLLCKQEREFMKLHDEKSPVNSYIDEQIILLLDMSKLLDENKIEELKLKIISDYNMLTDEEKRQVKNIDLIKNT